MGRFDIRVYIWNVYEICDFNKLKDIYLAFDMFIENLELGYERYKGANLDYESISNEWKSSPKSYQIYEKLIFKYIINKSQDKLCNAWVKKNKINFANACKVYFIHQVIRKI